jgi:hypothetical protein
MTTSRMMMMVVVDIVTVRHPRGLSAPGAHARRPPQIFPVEHRDGRFRADDVEPGARCDLAHLGSGEHFPDDGAIGILLSHLLREHLVEQHRADHVGCCAIAVRVIRTDRMTMRQNFRTRIRSSFDRDCPVRPRGTVPDASQGE